MSNPYSHHKVLDPNPRKGTRLASVGLQKEHWDAEDDRRFGELVAEVTRCTCGAFLSHEVQTIRVLPLDDPDWPMITFEETKECKRCGAIAIQYV